MEKSFSTTKEVAGSCFKLAMSSLVPFPHCPISLKHSLQEGFQPYLPLSHKVLHLRPSSLENLGEVSNYRGVVLGDLKIASVQWRKSIHPSREWLKHNMTFAIFALDPPPPSIALFPDIFTLLFQFVLEFLDFLEGPNENYHCYCLFMIGSNWSIFLLTGNKMIMTSELIQNACYQQ